MRPRRALESLPIGDQSRSPVLFKTRLTGEQLDALSQCAKGISLRFEAESIVDALVVGGYVKRGVAGVITVTTEVNITCRRMQVDRIWCFAVSPCDILDNLDAVAIPARR